MHFKDSKTRLDAIGEVGLKYGCDSKFWLKRKAHPYGLHCSFENNENHQSNITCPRIHNLHEDV
jgi:hypothetical protein